MAASSRGPPNGIAHVICPCKISHSGSTNSIRFLKLLSSRRFRRRLYFCRASITPSEAGNSNLSPDFFNSAKETSKVQKIYVAKRLSELSDEESDQLQFSSSFTNYQEDPLVDKLRTQLGVIHPIPSPPFNRNVVGFFVFFFFVGVAFDKLWTSRKKKKAERELQNGTWPQVPTSFSLFLEKDLQRKESVEWVNMVLRKLWKVYRSGIEDWIVGLLQPVIDNIPKPDYVQRVEIKQFSLGDEPLSVRNVERRTSRRINDLQYQIGLRYTGGARMALSLSLNFGIIPVSVPVWVRDFDIDGELWVKLRLIPTEPWVGAVSWAFVSLPKIKFELSPFRLFNLMAIPVLSMFLTKLLTEDLPRLFVRPKKIVLDFQKGQALGPVAEGLKTDVIQEGNNDFVGELSVTLVDARKLAYVLFGKTDPYVTMTLGDQVIKSKKNSQTTVIGRPGEPIWNQDFLLLVTNPKKQKLSLQVKDSFGFTEITIGSGEVELGSLQDTVPTDRIVTIRGGLGLFGKRTSGEVLLRLTYKAYVDDEEEEKVQYPGSKVEYPESDDDMPESGYNKWGATDKERESFMDLLAALLVSEEFQGIVSSESFRDSDLNGNGSRGNGGGSGGSIVDSEVISGDSKDPALIWLAALTSVAVLVSLNIGGSSFFNP
ncbi:Calcium-dependent lipid-binding (CaLB domain) family protein [Rhynchospora pubera]|uniref:Calcium-dependent lipid-binding (CaLB domain) family protein n=1 Tax=Rhynchospora pubera TaxID=906938 RepID=A0AAV8E237_9POAL|nr:Calcium-dependent lipid-binding (CaLB domain) family protein [Rhynchospora pubera]